MNASLVRGVLVALAAAIVGAAAGGWAGFRAGFGSVLDECVGREAQQIRGRVKILQGLRSGSAEAAVETLESDLDDALIILDPDTPYAGLRPKALAAVDQAIGEAKRYRAANPRHSKRPMVDRMVESLFSRKP